LLVALRVWGRHIFPIELNRGTDAGKVSLDMAGRPRMRQSYAANDCHEFVQNRLFVTSAPRMRRLLPQEFIDIMHQRNPSADSEQDTCLAMNRPTQGFGQEVRRMFIGHLTQRLCT